MKKTNHVCKYSKCNLGEDGGRKHYYACDYCDRTNSWRASACCEEHYELYVKEVLEARSKNKAIDTMPERTDKNETEIKELFEKPIEEVKAGTKQELNEYMSNGESIAEAVEKINTEIDNRSKSKRRRKADK